MLQRTWKDKYPFEIMVLIVWNAYPEVGLLDQIVILFLSFWGTSILFSSGYTILHPHQQCTGFHILLNTCYLLFFDNDHPNRWEMVSHCHLNCIFLMISEGRTILIPNLQDRELMSRDELIKVTWLVGARGGIWTQAEKLQDVHAWRGRCTVFHVLSKPGIMLFCILFFSLNVILEWFLITLNILLKHNFKAVGCMMAYLCCGHFMFNGPGMSQIFPFVRDSEDYIPAYLCLKVLLIIALA